MAGGEGRGAGIVEKLIFGKPQIVLSDAMRRRWPARGAKAACPRKLFSFAASDLCCSSWHRRCHLLDCRRAFDRTLYPVSALARARPAGRSEDGSRAAERCVCGGEPTERLKGSLLVGRQRATNARLGSGGTKAPGDRKPNSARAGRAIQSDGTGRFQGLRGAARSRIVMAPAVS